MLIEASKQKKEKELKSERDCICKINAAQIIEKNGVFFCASCSRVVSFTENENVLLGTQLITDSGSGTGISAVEQVHLYKYKVSYEASTKSVQPSITVIQNIPGSHVPPEQLYMEPGICYIYD
jgi:hypothetical protein